jgi:hypothetical protein
MPIPWPMTYPPRELEGALEESVGAKGAWSGEAYWPADAVPMYLNTFEYIVRNALQAWWRWLTADRAGCA